MRGELWWSLGLTAINVHCGCEGRKQAVSGRNIADRLTSAITWNLMKWYSLGEM